MQQKKSAKLFPPNFILPSAMEESAKIIFLGANKRYNFSPVWFC